MIRALLILAALVAATSARAAEQARYPASFVAGALRSVNPVYVTEPPYGAVCDGTTDDAAAFSAAYAALATAGGGTIVVPRGKTCAVASDIVVRSLVGLLCEPGGTLKASGSSSFSFGLLSSVSVGAGQFSTTGNIVEGCVFDLNTRLGPAFYLSGSDFTVRRNTISNGDTSEASDHNLAVVNCAAGAMCPVRDNVFTCASTSGAKDVGLQAAGAFISGNRVTGCDTYGISTSADSMVTTNVVSATGASGIGVYSTAVVTIRGNAVTASGATGKGIYVTSAGAYSSITDNRITASGASTIAIQDDASQSVVHGNRWQLTAATAGTDDAIGLYALGLNISVVGNVGNVTTSDAQTQMFLGGAQTVAVGNNLTKGAYCVRPIAGAINVNFSNNRCYAQSTIAVITTTGWIVDGNYLAWLGAAGRTLVLAGDDTGTKKYTVDHLNVTGNIIHSAQTGISGIETAVVSKTCNGGSKVDEPCTNSNTTDCPGATCGTCCVARTFEGMQFNGNHFLGVDTAIDFSTGVSSTGGDTWDVTVGGNTFDLDTSSGVAMKFPSSNQTKIRNIQIGPNSFVGSVRLQDWTPSMGFDAMTSRYYLPVGGCDVTGTATLTPLWSIPSTVGAAKACRPASGNYRWGVLQFAQAADKEAMTQVGLTGDANQSYSPVFVKLRFSYVTSSPNTVQWVIRAHCASPGDDPDFAAFSAENGTEAVVENIAGISNADGFMATSYLKLPLPDGCFGGDLLQILVSRDGNDTTGTDNYASDVNLFDAEVVVSINKMSN